MVFIRQAQRRLATTLKIGVRLKEIGKKLISRIKHPLKKLETSKTNEKNIEQDKRRSIQQMYKKTTVKGMRRGQMKKKSNK